MWTTKNPSHCSRCMSTDIGLEGGMFKKDAQGEDTNTVILGMWICKKCGNILGRRMNEYENDLDPESF